MEQDLLNVFDCETQCEYKGRHYRVRNNGAILRLPKEGCKPNQNDNVWTFGVKSEINGYMMFVGSIRVHQVVCTAFHGEAPEPHMVVDHIDSNRCNNRPENLRWLTRLENALNNEATRKKIIFLCGSIEAFINDPTILRSKALPPDISWMRTVSKEEAAACKRHMDEWAKKESTTESTGKGVDDWVFFDNIMRKTLPVEDGLSYYGFTPHEKQKTWGGQKKEIEELNRQHYLEMYGPKDSLTPGAKQLEWKTPTEFLQCPGEEQERTLVQYLKNLEPGKEFLRNCFIDKQTVLEAGINEAEKALYVLCYQPDNPVGKHWALCRITLENDYFVHQSKGTFYEEVGGKKYFTLAMGHKWTGGEVFDDFC